MYEKIIRWSYRWLPIICGCHCLDSRSFHFRGKRFPVCARCTGNLLGFFFGFILFFFVYKIPAYILVFGLLPLILDGTIQALTRYESNNVKRFITGCLFGFSFTVLYLKSIVFVANLGKEHALMRRAS